MGYDDWLTKPLQDQSANEAAWEYAAEDIDGEDPCDALGCKRHSHCHACIERRINDLAAEGEDWHAEQAISALEDC